MPIFSVGKTIHFNNGGTENVEIINKCQNILLYCARLEGFQKSLTLSLETVDVYSEGILGAFESISVNFLSVSRISGVIS